jgi:PAB1-binding protein PBP1
MDPIISGALQQKQAETAMKVQMSVLKKSMDVQKNVGEMLIGLIETVSDVAQASAKVVQTPAKTPGLGERLDVFA